jgi:hypothetical protein
MLVSPRPATSQLLSLEQPTRRFSDRPASRTNRRLRNSPARVRGSADGPMALKLLQSNRRIDWLIPHSSAFLRTNMPRADSVAPIAGGDLPFDSRHITGSCVVFSQLQRRLRRCFSFPGGRFQLVPCGYMNCDSLAWRPTT